MAEGGSKLPRSPADVRQSLWGAQNHSAGSMDRDFGALEDLLEALLVASRCPRDLQSLRILCPELFRRGFPSILNSPQLNVKPKNLDLELPEQPSEHLSRLIK